MIWMRWLSIALLVVILSYNSTADNKHRTALKPNILIAIADDATWLHFSAYGCSWVKTPGFDYVAKNGILFTRAYTPNAKCAPSRSCILTGRNSWQLEEAANHSPNFPRKFKTYVEALDEHGYWVGSTGKGWAPGNPGVIDGKARELTGPKYDRYKITPPAKFISNNNYFKNFEDFLEERPDGQPFCFWYGSNEPHRPYEFEAGINYGGKLTHEIDFVPSFWPDVDTVRKDMLDYAFELEYFDSHLQKMLLKLDEIGELQNTLVIVTADNGMPFPRVKGQEYEYSNHLPLAIMWPDGIKNPGRVVDDYISFIDLAPTFLEVAGLTSESAGMQSITGKSLIDIFDSENGGTVTNYRNFVLIGKERHDVGRPNDWGYPIRGLIKNDFLYLYNFKIDRWPAGNPETGYLNCDGSPTKTYVLDTRRKKGVLQFWQLNFGKRDQEELYNVKKDPFCVNNLAYAPEFMQVKEDMYNELKFRLTEQADPRILGRGDIFDKYEYSGANRNFYNRFMRGEQVKAGWINETDFDTDVNR